MSIDNGVWGFLCNPRNLQVAVQQQLGTNDFACLVCAGQSNIAREYQALTDAKAQAVCQKCHAIDHQISSLWLYLIPEHGSLLKKVGLLIGSQSLGHLPRGQVQFLEPHLLSPMVIYYYCCWYLLMNYCELILTPANPTLLVCSLEIAGDISPLHGA